MSAEKDITIDEKRVYGAKTGATVAYVASGAGLARVRCSGDLVGEFGLAWRGDCRDVAAGPRLAVATSDDVLTSTDGETFESTGFGPATAVGFHDDALLAAGHGGVARRDETKDDWRDLGDCDEVRAIDGPFVASADGVFRVGSGSGSDGDAAGLTAVGLSDAHDVFAGDAEAGTVPRAATAHGLYRLGNGWMDDLDGDFRVVTGRGDRVHAASADALYALDGRDWRPVDLPVAERVAGVAYGERTYAVTADGTFLVEREREGNRDEEGDGDGDGDEGWSTRSLGLPAVSGVVVA